MHFPTVTASPGSSLQNAFQASSLHSPWVSLDPPKMNPNDSLWVFFLCLSYPNITATEYKCEVTLPHEGGTSSLQCDPATQPLPTSLEMHFPEKSCPVCSPDCSLHAGHIKDGSLRCHKSMFMFLYSISRNTSLFGRHFKALGCLIKLWFQRY